MNEYERIALEQRKKVSKLTLEQQKQILEIYENVVENLSSKAASAKDKTLTERWLLDYLKELSNAKKELHREIFYETNGAIGKAAKIGNEAIERIVTMIFRKAKIDPGEHFTSMFSVVQKGVIEDIISGGLYKDRLTLSQRIWNHSNKFENDIQYIVNKAILEKKSALELARDLERFVRNPAKRPWSWGKVYPNLKGTKIDYNAQRLSRTSINHAYQTASIKSSSMNPFVEGIEWRSAMIHGRTCELCIERATEDKYGLGPGIFPIGQVPLDHPQGLCTMIPHILQSLDVVATELRDWIDGGDDKKLDGWYSKYGEYFAFKKM